VNVNDDILVRILGTTFQLGEPYITAVGEYIDMYDAAKIETEGIESYIDAEIAPPVVTSQKSKSASNTTSSKSTKNSKKKD
jgi:hypothetical protein